MHTCPECREAAESSLAQQACICLKVIDGSLETGLEACVDPEHLKAAPTTELLMEDTDYRQ